VRIEISAKSILLAVVAVAGCWVILHLFTIVLVVVGALFLVGTLNPAVEWLQARGFSRGAGTAIVFTALFVLIALLGILTVPALFDQVRALVAKEPELRGKLANALARSRVTAGFATSVRELRYDTLARTTAGTLLAISSRAIEIVAYLSSAVFLALYMVIDRDRLRGGLFAIVARAHHVRLSRILLKLETIVSGYIRGQVLTSALMAVFVFVLLAVCRVPNPLPIAVFAGMADVLPYIGVVLSVAPAALAASANGFLVAAIVVAILLAYEEFESRFLVPRIYGRALRLPSSIVLLSLLIGGTLLGIVGALLALPVASTVRMLIEELRVILPGEQINETAIRRRDATAEQEYAERSDGLPAVAAAAIAIEISEQRQEQEALSLQELTEQNPKDVTPGVAPDKLPH
jgi:predicted PurR-regulated permease PerM